MRPTPGTAPGSQLSAKESYFLSAFPLGRLLWYTGNQRLAYKLVDIFLNNTEYTWNQQSFCLKWEKHQSNVTSTFKVSVNLFLYYLFTQLSDLCWIRKKLCRQMFWCWHETGLVKITQTIPCNPFVSFKSTCLYAGLKLIQVITAKGTWRESHTLGLRPFDT